MPPTGSPLRTTIVGARGSGLLAAAPVAAASSVTVFSLVPQAESAATRATAARAAAIFVACLIGSPRVRLRARRCADRTLPDGRCEARDVGSALARRRATGER